MFLQEWLLPSLGRQETLCKLCSLTALALLPHHHGSHHHSEDRDQRQHSTTEELLEEGKFVLYPVGQPVRLGFLAVGFFSLFGGFLGWH